MVKNGQDETQNQGKNGPNLWHFGNFYGKNILAVGGVTGYARLVLN
jgi:hypothetical protein